ncbi:MAG: NFACT family protein [Candidatus Micrarchaeia archaeon]
MRMLYGLEFLFLARELKQANGYFIDNFYELGKGRFRLKLTRNGEQMNLLCVLPYSVSSASVFERAGTPTNFSIAARKRICGFRIVEVSRLNNDRIIMFELKKGAEGARAILELFGKGNFIVTDQAGKITLAYMQHKFSDREVRIGEQYVPPKSEAVDLLDSASVSKAIADATTGDSGISEALQKKLQVGKPYVAQILADIGVDAKAKQVEFNSAKQKRFKEELEDYMSGSKGFYLYKNNSVPVDFSVGMLEKYEGFEAVRFDSINGVLAAFYESEPIVEKESAANVEIEKSIEKQKALIAETEAEISESKRSADFIFANMEEINRIIEYARRSKHATKEELQKLSKSIKIKDVDLKNKTITIEIEDQ